MKTRLVVLAILVPAVVASGCGSPKTNHMVLIEAYRSSVSIGGTSPGPPGHCWLDFDFDLSQRFWVAMAYDETSVFVTCILDDSDDDILTCSRWKSDGSTAGGDIMVLVY